MLHVLASAYRRARDLTDLFRSERGVSYIDYAMLGGAALIIGGAIFTTVVPAVKTYLSSQIVTPLGNLK